MQCSCAKVGAFLGLPSLTVVSVMAFVKFFVNGINVYLPTFSEISEDFRRRPKSSEDVRSLLKTSEVFQRSPKSFEDV